MKLLFIFIFFLIFNFSLLDCSDCTGESLGEAEAQDSTAKKRLSIKRSQIGDKKDQFRVIKKRRNSINQTKVVLLGTGTPNAEPKRSGPSTAIIVNGVPYIIDCGPGIVRRASLAIQEGISGLRFPLLNTAFITHLHSDHTAGYSDLIFTPWALGRVVPMEVFGPPGIKPMTDHILQAYKEDIRVRVEGLSHLPPEGCKVNVHEIERGGLIYEDENIRVKAFAVHHGIFKYAFGYRFETHSGVIVISGDTTPVETLVEQAEGCDLLIHEVYGKSYFDNLPPDRQKYYLNAHTSTIELAEIANKVNPGTLVLYHQLHKGFPEEELVREVMELYKGEVVYGHDLDVYEL